MSSRRWQNFRAQARITRGALYLLFVTAGLSLVYMMGSEEMRGRMLHGMAASGHALWGEFELWKLVTSPLLETEFVALLFQGFALWMFLPALERWWGMKKFLLFALYVSLTGVVAGTVVGLALGGVHGFHFVSGLDPLVFGGIVAYGVLFADHNVQFFGVLPMTGKQLTWGIVAFVALFVILGQAWVEGAALAAAMILAWAMTSGKISPKLWMLKNKQRRLRKKSHLKLVKDDDKKERWLN